MKILKKNYEAEEKRRYFRLVLVCFLGYISQVITSQLLFWLNTLLKVDAANIQKCYFECATYGGPRVSHCS